MIEELKQKCEAIAIRQRTDLEARKREELEGSLEEGKVADPVTILISLAISAAVSAASYALTAVLTPKPPRGQQGKLTGSLQLQNSEQGIFIPEIYGGSPTTSLVTGSNPTYQNLANVTGGANGSITKTAGGSSWNAGASHNVSISAGQDAFFQFTLGTGYAGAGFTLDSSPINANTDFLFMIQWNPDSSITVRSDVQSVGAVTTWATGDVFRLELRSGRFRLYKGSAEIVPPNFIYPSPSYPLFMGIAMQFVGAGISAAKVQIGSIGPAPNSGRGGIKIPAIIVWSSGIRKLITTTQVPTGGGKGGGGRTQTVDNITYNIDLGLMFGRGPNSLIRLYANADILIDQFSQSANPSGVYDPTVGADPDYDPDLPPDPTLNHPYSFLRVDGDIPFDGDNVGTGTIQGGGSGFAIYSGNNTQQPDPTIEADIDGKYGPGSTPAYRNHSLAVLSTLSLSRWGGVVPNITAVWEHETLRTLDVIFASLCERVGVLTANGDYDFTGIPIVSRGLLISGRPFQPKEVIGSPDLQLAYSYFVTEADGQIIGYAEGSEPSVTIPDTEIGWLEGDADLPDIAPEVESLIASEITLPREVHVKSLDPDKDWEPNTASAMRQITDGSRVELLEIQICQLSDERRETAQRKLYRDYVAGTAYKITVPWTYMYVYPGYRVIITRAEGFTHTSRLKGVNGGIGVIEWELEALEPATFNQPANGVFPPGYIPPQPIPAMIVMSILDVPLFREADKGKLGWYAGGTPRTGVNQTFQGWTLHSQRNSVWSLRASSNLPAIIGSVVSATALSNDPETFDNVGTITIDLYGTTMTLSSVTEADVLAGMNRAVVREFILGFTTATQVVGFPNRWTLSGLLNGLFGTDQLVAGTLTGARFVLLDNAIQFVPANLDELDLSLPFRGVANGQSLGDAAEFNFAWTGQILKGERPTSISGPFDQASGALLLDWIDQAGPTADDTFDLIIRSAANGGGIIRRGPITIKPLDLARISSTPPLIVLASGGFFLDSTSYTFIDPGGFNAVYTSDEWNVDGKIAVVEADNSFSLAGGGMIETQVATGGGVNALFPSFWGILPTLGGDPNIHGWVKAGTTDPDTIRPRGSPIGDFDYTMVAGDRFTIQISPDGTISYYINYMGAISDPWYVSPDNLDLTLMYRLQFDNTPYNTGVSSPTYTVAVRNTRWLRNVPEFTYTGEMQKLDNGGSLPSVVHVGVRKKSSHPLGPPSDWLYATFVRP
jgi:hypothetical protein